jgi:hypothetical protein
MQQQTGAATMGRPPVPKHLKRTERLVVQLTPSEMASFNAAFAESGAPDRSEFARGIFGNTLKRTITQAKRVKT